MSSCLFLTEKWSSFYAPEISSSGLSHSILSAIIVPCVLVVTILTVALMIYVLRHKRLQRSFLSYASSHYDTRSGTARFSTSDELGMYMLVFICYMCVCACARAHARMCVHVCVFACAKVLTLLTLILTNRENNLWVHAESSNVILLTDTQTQTDRQTDTHIPFQYSSAICTSFIQYQSLISPLIDCCIIIFLDEEEQPMIQGFSDDEPLIVA